MIRDLLKRWVRGNMIANCWRIKRGIIRQASIECTFNSVHIGDLHEGTSRPPAYKTKAVYNNSKRTDCQCTVAHNCHIKFKLLTSNSNYSHQIQIAHIKFKSLTSNSNRVSDWSAAKSMNTILSFHSLFHFTAILCDRYFQCMLSVYCLIHRSEISSKQNVLQ